MLTHLRIKNFKSWQDTGNIAFGKITAFFGTNSSGKSALLRFLMMLKQTVESNDQQQILHTGDRNSYVDVGTFFDFIYQRNPDNKLEFEFGWQSYGLYADELPFLSPEDESPYSSPNNGELPSSTPEDELSQPLSFAMTIKQYRNDIIADTLSFSAKNLLFNGTDSEVIPEYNVRLPEWSVSILTGTESTDLLWVKDGTKIQRGKFYDLPKHIEFAEDRSENFLERLEILHTSSKIQNEIERLFQHTYYLGPLREPPERLYIWGGQAPQDVGRRGELTIAALLSERGREIQPRIAELLVQMGLAHSFKVAPIAEGRREHEVLIQLKPGATPVGLTDVGVGLSQVLPVLVLCWYVPKGSIIIFEQPELHLHPRAQYGLADVFIAATRERDVQIILESHSEHLLTRLQRRIAEGNITDEEVCLYFTELDDTGTSQLGRLAMDEYGNITNFPPDFFGNDLNELGAMLDAEINRSSTSSTEDA